MSAVNETPSRMRVRTLYSIMTLFSCPAEADCGSALEKRKNPEPNASKHNISSVARRRRNNEQFIFISPSLQAGSSSLYCRALAIRYAPPSAERVDRYSPFQDWLLWILFQIQRILISNFFRLNIYFYPA